ncbi:MAG: stage II sporulation protein P [Ruminococcus flavefaciens]|nr:stage II sporulation protein P [Ruminococcus flavefaciens]MCM1229109.1 stage II sporulation protein P [Ruminococcus flavefaciens]
MTRFKRRKIAGAVKCIALMLVPFCTAGLAKGIPAVKLLAERMNSISVGGTDEQPVQKSYSFSHEKASEDVLNGKIILSEGYGFEAEEFPADIDLQSPLDMVSDNPGDKPYPSEEDWTEGGVPITRTTYGEYSGTTYFNLSNGGQVNNKTSLTNELLLRESCMSPDFTIDDTDEPQVLIYHTHTTESFEPYVRDNLDADFNYRTTDETKNMIMVGNAIQAELEAQGIGVIHVTEIHDYPSYNGSYGRSRESIVPILEQYPSIKVALDIHRDAISNSDFAAQPYIEIDGKEAAQIMIISGCDDGTLDMPNYMNNFHFACNLQQQFERDYPGFTRPILFDYRHYNQDLTNGSLLIEVGSHGNTLEQVQYSGQLIGRSLCNLLNSIKE